MNPDPDLMLYTKINVKWVMNLNAEDKAIKHLEKQNQEINLWDIRLRERIETWQQKHNMWKEQNW